MGNTVFGRDPERIIIHRHCAAGNFGKLVATRSVFESVDAIEFPFLLRFFSFTFVSPSVAGRVNTHDHDQAVPG